jgi:hypothetical protein
MSNRLFIGVRCSAQVLDESSFESRLTEELFTTHEGSRISKMMKK